MAEETVITSDNLEPGFVLAGRYQIERLLGSGGMGSVYLCRDLQEARQIALKVLHKELAANKPYVKRFLQEAELMNQVRDANVVQTFEIGTDGGLIYFSMEYVPGESLEQMIQQGTFPMDSAAELILQICSGLSAIHAHEIIHRDLKPGNILVLDDGRVKITDFGVARPKSSTLTERDQKVGSVYYMAPEIWQGKSLTAAVDLYALGVLLYELCTGELPFPDEAPADLMMRHLKRPPQPPRELNPEVPPWLNQLIVRLLEKSPKDRFRSAADVCAFVQSRSRQMRVFERSGETEETPLVQRGNSKSFPAAKVVEADRRTFLLKLSATQVMDRASEGARSRRRRKATVVLPLPRHAALVLEIETPSRDFLYLGLFFASLQIADGYLTSVGISRFGVLKEGNPLLRYLMSHFSPDQTLLIAKGFAILIVAVLTMLARRSKLVKDLIGVLSCIYLFAAIIPWIYILYIKNAM